MDSFFASDFPKSVKGLLKAEAIVLQRDLYSKSRVLELVCGMQRYVCIQKKAQEIQRLPVSVDDFMRILEGWQDLSELGPIQCPRFLFLTDPL